MGKSYNYLFPSDPTDTYGKGVVAHEGRIIVYGHPGTNGGYHWANYSDTDDPTLGYDTQSFRVGGSDQDWLFAFNLRGGCIAIKDNSIWLKNTIDVDGITNTQWDLIVSDIATVRQAIVADGDVYVLTYEGLARFTGNALDYVSRPVQAEWSTASDSWTLGYWRSKRWILCSNLTTGYIYIFEMDMKRWLVINTNHDGYCIANPSGKLIFWDGTNQPKFINENGHTDLAGTLWFPFVDMENPYVDKYLRKIYLNYTGTLTITVYGRMHIGGTITTLMSKTISNETRTGTGTISAATTDPTVTGVGTVFTTELQVGDYITVTAHTQTLMVTRIDSNTSLELETPPTATLSAESFTYTRAQDTEPQLDTFDVPWREISVKLVSSSTGCMIKGGPAIEYETRDMT